MPKKFQGENTKSSVARARKAEKVAEEKFMKEKAVADAYWKDDDKLVNKKFQRKEEKEKKRLEDIERKKSNKLLEEEEANVLAPPVQTVKLTAFQIREQKEKDALTNGENIDKNVQISDPLTENLNRLDDDQDTISASGMDAAVAALSTSESTTTDKHPERRMAAAFKSYETQRLPQLKKEFPSMRLSQLNQKLRKEWQKSPANPLNKNS